MTYRLGIDWQHLVPLGIAAGASNGRSEACSVAKLLHPAASSSMLSPRSLARLAARLAKGLEWDEWELEDHGDREYRRIFATKNVEAWMISWKSGSFLQLHDHGGSSGALCVIDGTLLEASADLASNEALRTERIEAGSPRSFSGSHVHELWNPSRKVARSVHVYSAPLSKMDFYDHRRGRFLEHTHRQVELVAP